LKNGKTFTFNEVKFSQFFSTCTSVGVALLFVIMFITKIALAYLVDFKTHLVTFILMLRYPSCMI